MLSVTSIWINDIMLLTKNWFFLLYNTKPEWIIYMYNIVSLFTFTYMYMYILYIPCTCTVCTCTFLYAIIIDWRISQIVFYPSYVQVWKIYLYKIMHLVILVVYVQHPTAEQQVYKIYIYAYVYLVWFRVLDKLPVWGYRGNDLP